MTQMDVANQRLWLEELVWELRDDSPSGWREPPLLRLVALEEHPEDETRRPTRRAYLTAVLAVLIPSILVLAYVAPKLV